MITIKKIDCWPKEVTLSHLSQLERNTADYTYEELFKLCSVVWSIKKDGEIIMIAGVVQKGMISATPELWLSTTTKMKPIYTRSLQFAVNSLIELYPTGLFFRTSNKTPVTKRFAVFMGFNPISQDEQYTYYEVH